MSQTFSLTLRQEADYRFVVDFDQPGVEPLVVDEHPPLGEGAGPNPTRLLGAAVASCLSASLLFCMRKARLPSGSITTTVDGDVERDDRNRLRVSALRVRIRPTLAEEDLDRIGRCVDVFEDFCTVTQSVREGIHVDVEVEPVAATGTPPDRLVAAGA